MLETGVRIFTMTMTLAAQYVSSLVNDPEFHDLKEDTMRLIQVCLLSLPAISDIPNYMNGYLNQPSNLRLGARHEAGHIMMLWFSNSQVDVSYATIIPPDERGSFPCSSERFQYKGMENFLSDRKNHRSYFFDSICFYMGGIRCEQRHMKEKIVQCQRDVHFLCIKAFRLALATLEDFPGIRSIKEVALVYIRASFYITNELLMEKRDLFTLFEIELYKKRFMNRNEIVKMIGQRPKHGVNLYEKFLKEYVPKLDPGCFTPLVVLPYNRATKPQTDAVQENVIVDSSPKIYTQL